MKRRRKHSPDFKAQVALEAIREESTVAEIAVKYQVHPSQVQLWKAEALTNMSALFDKAGKKEADAESKIASLERKVGQLTIENDFFLKKKLAALPEKERRQMIEVHHDKLSIRCQSGLLSLNRSRWIN